MDNSLNMPIERFLAIVEEFRSNKDYETAFRLLTERLTTLDKEYKKLHSAYSNLDWEVNPERMGR